MDDAELLDACWAAEVDHNDHRPLWDGDIAEIERWPRTSTEATARARDELGDVRGRALAAVDGSDLGVSLRTAADAALLVAATKDVESELTFLHPDLGLHSYLFWAVNDLPLRSAEHGASYLAKLGSFGTCVDELRGRASEAAAAGRAPIAPHTARSIEKLEAHLASAVDDDPLLRQPAPTDLDPEAAAAWRTDVREAVVTHVRPALQRLRDTLRDDTLPAGRDEEHCGILHQPGGEEVYAELVAAFTAEGVTPDQVHETGLAQVARLADEYRELGAEAFGTSDLDEVFARLRDDEDLAFDDADEIVRVATALHERAEAAAPAYFLRVPEAACRVRATETGSMGFYSPPSADGSRPGIFFLNTSTPQIWGPNLAATVFHEGVPGHHFQAALALESADLHELHRRLFLPAFGEGWALYTERLADEMGLYEDEVQRLGMLATDSLRACRLVVDTGLHALGWSRREAIDYMLANAPMQVAEVTAEVDRYIGMPGQATSYMMGRLTIEELRDEAAATLGDDFSVQAFHDVVLSQGMVSLPALRAMVRAWAAR